MIYLVVGLDRRTLTRWHKNIHGKDVVGATRAALARAGADGVDLVVAAVIGPGSNVVDGHRGAPARLASAARRSRNSAVAAVPCAA